MGASLDRVFAVTLAFVVTKVLNMLAENSFAGTTYCFRATEAMLTTADIDGTF